MPARRRRICSPGGCDATIPVLVDGLLACGSPDAIAAAVTRGSAVHVLVHMPLALDPSLRIETAASRDAREGATPPVRRPCPDHQRVGPSGRGPAGGADPQRSSRRVVFWRSSRSSPPGGTTWRCRSAGVRTIGSLITTAHLVPYVAVRGQLSPVDGAIELIDIDIDLHGLDPAADDNCQRA